MRSGPHTRIAQVDAVFVLAYPCRQLFVIVGWHGGPRHDRHRHFVDHAQKCEVGVHLKPGLAVERRHGGHANVVDQNRVTIGRGAGHFLRGNRTTRAQYVFHHDAAHTQWLAQGFGHVTRQSVGRSAGRERHDDSDGLVLDGETLRESAAHGPQRQRECTGQSRKSCVLVRVLLPHAVVKGRGFLLFICNCAHLQSPCRRWAGCPAPPARCPRAIW